MQGFISVPDTAVTVARVGGGGGRQFLTSSSSSSSRWRRCWLCRLSSGLGWTETSELVDHIEDRVSHGRELNILSTAAAAAVAASSGEVEEEGPGPHLPLGLSVDLLHHEDVAGAVLPAAPTSIPVLLSLLGSDQAEEPPVVTVDSTEPECKISLLTEAFVISMLQSHY